MKNNDAVFLTLENADNVKSSFMQAVENALKRRVIKFHVDIAQNLSALDEIFLQLVALQKVLSKRAERLVLVSHISLPPELETRLHEAGVQLKVEQEVKNLSDAQSPIGTHFAEFYQQAQSKNWPPLAEKFKQIYEELKTLIQSERGLQKEIEFYKKRMISLRPLITEKLNLALIAKQNAEQEEFLKSLYEQNEAMQIQIAQLSQDLQAKKAKYKDLSERPKDSDKTPS